MTTEGASLLIATNNAGKAREFRHILSGLPFRIVSLHDLGIRQHVEESGTTFVENARLKARGYADLSGILTLADDSGLEVDALGGAPGVRSARYAGEQASDEDRYRLLLDNLEGVPSERRTARFRCAIAIAEPRGRIWTVEGSLEGFVAHTPAGSGGFGYDPVFFVPDMGRSLAELTAAEKNRISHRARAGHEARRLLETLADGPGGR